MAAPSATIDKKEAAERPHILLSNGLLIGLDWKRVALIRNDAIHVVTALAQGLLCCQP